MGITKVFSPQSEWNDKEEFLDVIYWGRQILGILLDLVWGLLPLKGFLGLVLFAGISAGVVYVWITAIQGIDEAEYGGAWELTKEGFLTSAAGFLVTWIIVSPVSTSTRFALLLITQFHFVSRVLKRVGTYPITMNSEHLIGSFSDSTRIEN